MCSGKELIDLKLWMGSWRVRTFFSVDLKRRRNKIEKMKKDEKKGEKLEEAEKK